MGSKKAADKAWVTMWSRNVGEFADKIAVKSKGQILKDATSIKRLVARIQKNNI